MNDLPNNHSVVYENILHSMDNGVISLDFEGKIITFNKSASKILGIPDEEAIGKNYPEVFFQNSENNDFNDVLVGAIYSEKIQFYREVYFFRKDKTSVPLGITCSVLKNQDDDEYGIVAVFTDLTHTRKSQFLEDTLTRYVTKQVVSKILEDPDKLDLDGEDCCASILFTDIRSFTSITEQTEPKDLVKMLRAYFTLMVGAVFEHNGMVDKFIGDSIMAIFGAPVKTDQHGIHAVETALEMKSHIEVYNASREEKGLDPIFIGVGINTGNVVVGNIGSHDRFEYTAIGDTVNLASRLEGINKIYNTDIIVSKNTYEEVKDYVIARELDKIYLKGKKEALPIYEILDRQSEVSDKTLQFRDIYQDGLKYFRNREWDRALDSFLKSISIKPGDIASHMYIKRCEKYKCECPAEDWNYAFYVK